MGMAFDLGYIDPVERYAELRRSGVPADVAASIINNPSYGEGEFPDKGWSHRYGGREYQPGGSQMPGMPWDDPSMGAGMMGGGLTPDMIKRIQMYQAIMGNRGAAGMQPNLNTNALISQLQGGGQQNPMGLSPQIMAMLNYYMQQQQQGGPGQYPQGGGGVTLAQLLGAPQQMGQSA